MRYVSGILIMSALTIALPPAAPALAQQGQDLYQQALRKENVEGDLRAAIELYQRIAREFAEDRALVARALVHMGLSYEKLGEPEAQAVYQRVLRDYADQRDAVQQAQARIAAADSRVQQDGLVARRVWDGPEVDLFGAVSSDGQLLTYVDWSTGDLAIRDLTTGETRRLTNTGYPEYAMFSILSPDGTRVAYEWSGATAPGESRWELRIIGVDGSEPRVLYHDPGGPLVEPKAWTPDGAHILAVSVREDQTAQIVLISVADGSVRVLKSLDWRWPREMSLSPDGRSIVYAVPPLGDAPQNFDTGQGGLERDLFLLAADGSREIPLVEHPADDSAPVWTPDGKRVLFTSDRTGEPAMWAVDVADGTPTGSARIVGEGMGSPLGVTASGAYYFGRRPGQQHIYMAALDPATSRLTASPTKLIQRVEEVSREPSWSPDGRFLAYHTGGIFDSGDVVVRSRDTGAERRFEHGLGMVRMRWFPDGRSLLLMGSDGQFRPGIYQLDVESGVTTLLLRLREEDVFPFPTSPLKAAPALSPDGTTIFHTRQISASGSSSTQLLAYHLTTGEDREIHHTEAPVLINGLAVSPDGRQVAFSTVGGTPEWGTSSAPSSASLHMMPVGGGEVRHLLTMPGDTPYVTPIAWTPDGRGLFLTEPLPFTQGGRHIGLWRISLDGGEPVRIDLQVDGEVADPSVHPDGRQIAFIGRVFTQEVWVVENLLADLERQQ